MTASRPPGIMFELVENHGRLDDMNQIVQNHSATVKKSEINSRYFGENVQCYLLPEIAMKAVML
jgi:hypothetical protein